MVAGLTEVVTAMPNFKLDRAPEIAAFCVIRGYPNGPASVEASLGPVNRDERPGYTGRKGRRGDGPAGESLRTR